MSAEIKTMSAVYDLAVSPPTYDFFSFLAEAGVTYVVESSRLGERADTVLYLYDGQGNELALDDDGGDDEGVDAAYAGTALPEQDDQGDGVRWLTGLSDVDGNNSHFRTYVKWCNAVGAKETLGASVDLRRTRHL